MINAFDIDGVIFMGEYGGVYPGPDDIIITGRSFEERSETEEMLRKKGISNLLFMNPIPFNKKTRKSSGLHKAKTLFYLENMGYRFGIFFEDDPIQLEQIKKIMPHINVVLLEHDIVEKENVRHP